MHLVRHPIVSQVLQAGGAVPLDQMRRAPWYVSLYLKLNDKTRSRDLVKLRGLGLLRQDEQKRLWPEFDGRPSLGPM